MFSVKQILDSKGSYYISISPNASVYSALQIMADRDVGALLVVEDNRVVGIFSERDYARKVILKGRSSKETRVEELMSSPVITVGPEDSIEHCMALMTTKKHRHLPVIDGEKIAGVISIGDVVGAIIASQKSMIQDLETYITGTGYPVTH